MDRDIVVAALQEVKDTCEDHEFCTEGCPYYDENGDECYLRHSPNNWDIDSIV